MTLVDSGHHVRAKITGLKTGDPLILRRDTGEPRFVVWAQRDQEDDSRIPTSDDRNDRSAVLFWVWPKTGKVQEMGLYAERCTTEEAEAALREIAAKAKH
jgi:hypothetical protein